jgi:hypothetical protein
MNIDIKETLDDVFSPMFAGYLAGRFPPDEFKQYRVLESDKTQVDDLIKNWLEKNGARDL